MMNSSVSALTELLRAIQIQVLCHYILSPSTHFHLRQLLRHRIDISIHVVESQITNLILDGKLHHSVNALIQRIIYGGGDSFDGQ
jgi:hypothetical protein